MGGNCNCRKSVSLASLSIPLKEKVYESFEIHMSLMAYALSEDSYRHVTLLLAACGIYGDGLSIQQPEKTEVIVFTETTRNKSDVQQTICVFFHILWLANL